MTASHQVALYADPATVPRPFSLVAWARHTAFAVAVSVGTSGAAAAIAAARDWVHDRTAAPVVAAPDLAAALADERPVIVSIGLAQCSDYCRREVSIMGGR